MKQCDTAIEWGKERGIEDEEELNRIIEGGKPWTIICKKGDRVRPKPKLLEFRVPV